MKIGPLVKSTRMVSAATLASKILGFIRDVIIAKFFGTGFRAQAFVVAFRIPNLLRSMVGEGGTNSAVVPVLSRLNEQGRTREFWEVASCLLNVSVVLLTGLVLLGELFAPYIVRVIAPGFIGEPVKLNLTIRLTRFLFPYLFLIGLTAYATAVLNSLKVFALPALAPCMLNIGLIASSLIFCPRLEEPVDGLALGVLIGGLLQLSIQIPLLVRKGLFRKRGYHFVHPRIKEIGRLFLPRILGIAIYQINLFIDTIFASLAFIVGEGAPAALQFANRIIQFPLALFAVALAQVALPAMSGLALREDFTQLKRTISFSLRSVFTIMIPATAGLMVLAYPLVKMIFERGNFTSYSTDITSFALFFYCLGLTGYAGVKVLASCFYSLKDTFTPGKVAAFALLINIVLNLILMHPLGMGGLALATSISVTVNFALLLFILKKKVGRFDHLGLSLSKIILATTIMGLALWFIFYRMDLISGKLSPGVRLIVAALAAAMVYLGVLKIFAREEAGIFAEWILRKR